MTLQELARLNEARQEAQSLRTENETLRGEVARLTGQLTATRRVLCGVLRACGLARTDAEAQAGADQLLRWEHADAQPFRFSGTAL